jgi:hypothetical protein
VLDDAGHATSVRSSGRTVRVVGQEAHVGDSSWTFLLVGSFAALGAAMAVGTLAALWTYRRTGTFPGSEEPAELPPQRLVVLWARVVVGLVLAGIGIEALRRVGIL